MIDSMFQPGTDQALNDQVARPRPIVLKQPSFWAGWDESSSRGLSAAGLQSAAFGTEILGAFGQVMGSYPELMGGPLTDEQKQQGEQARRKLITTGIDYSTPYADELRTKARSIMPDPATTGTAAQLTAGFLNFGAKAMGYTLTMGPLGPLALGGDVGMEEADRLKQEGVDIDTRTKAGGVAGVMAAASVVLPMSGATKTARFVKGVVGGEATMIGQSLAEKAILKAAGYQKQADSFDPLDPVSLAMGVVPGLLGAKFGHAPAKPSTAPRSLSEMGLGERQALPYNDVSLDAYAIQAAQKAGIPPEILLAVKNAGEKSGSTATSPKGAQGVMQFMPATAKEMGIKDVTDPVQAIDGAAAYLAKLHKAYGDWDAAVAHYNGGGSEAALVRSGGVPAKPETAAYLARVKDYIGKTVDDHASAAVRANPELEAAARVQQAADALESSNLAHESDLAGRDAHVSAVEMAADQMGRGDPINVMPAFGDTMLDSMRASRLIDDHIAALQDQRAQLLSDAGNLMEPGAVRDLRAQVEALQAAAPDTSTKAVKAMAKDMQDSDRISYKEASAQAQKQMDTIAADHAAQLQRLTDQLDTHARAAQAQEAIGHLDRQIGEATQAREAIPGPRTSPKSLALAISDAFSAKPIEQPARIPELARQPQEKPLAAPEAGSPKEGKATPGEAAQATGVDAAGQGEPQAAGVSQPGRAGDGQAAGLTQAAIDRAAAEVSMLHPDMLVQLDGMDYPMRVGDLLAKVQEEAAQEKRSAKLMEVAAACALRT